MHIYRKSISNGFSLYDLSCVKEWEVKWSKMQRFSEVKTNTSMNSSWELISGLFSILLKTWKDWCKLSHSLYIFEKTELTRLVSFFMFLIRCVNVFNEQKTAGGREGFWPWGKWRKSVSIPRNKTQNSINKVKSLSPHKMLLSSRGITLYPLLIGSPPLGFSNKILQGEEEWISESRTT